MNVLLRKKNLFMRKFLYCYQLYTSLKKTKQRINNARFSEYLKFWVNKEQKRLAGNGVCQLEYNLTVNSAFRFKLTSLTSRII